ncbi:MAG: hypothetical protein ACRDRU_17055 [Pseudonocardiaceae bacterium]
MAVAGGSLTACNERILLERYPNLIIGRGAGEPTIADVLAHWHDDLAMQHIRGAGYQGATRGEGTCRSGHAAPPPSPTGSKPTCGQNSTCWNAPSPTTASPNWSSAGAALTTARSAHAATKDSGPEPPRTPYRGC